MKKIFVISIVLVMLATSLAAQEKELGQETQPSAARHKVTTFDSFAPRFSRDHLPTWSKARRGPKMATEGLAAPGGFPPQTHSQQVRKRRQWPYLVSAGAMLTVGTWMTARYHHCEPSPTPLTVTCSPWTSHWVLGGGIALMGGGGALLVYGATR